jgi:hypothetical protein
MIWTPAITASTSAALVGMVAAHDGSQGLVLMLLDLFPRDLGRSPCGCRMEKMRKPSSGSWPGSVVSAASLPGLRWFGRGDIFLRKMLGVATVRATTCRIAAPST